MNLTWPKPVVLGFDAKQRDTSPPTVPSSGSFEAKNHNGYGT